MMATYKYPNYIQHLDHDAFDKQYHPGIITPSSGIYRCMGCGREDVSTQGHPLLPQNHHQHTVAQGPILWRLIVFADLNPNA